MNIVNFIAYLYINDSVRNIMDSPPTVTTSAPTVSSAADPGFEHDNSNHFDSNLFKFAVIIHDP